MRLEGGRISASELAWYVMAVTVGPSLVPLPGGNAGRGQWIAILIGLVEGSLFDSFL